MDSDRSFSEDGYMAKLPPTRLAEIRKAHGWTQQQLGDAVGAHWITISKLERGKMQMTFTWLEKISSALNVLPAQLLSNDYLSQELILTAQIIDATVRLTGNERIAIKTYAYEHSEDASFWIRCSDESLRPHFREGDLIKFVQIDAINACDHIGRIAMVSDQDMDNSLFGVLELSTSSHLIELRRFNSSTIRGYKPKYVWLASDIKFYLVAGVEL